MGSGQPSRRFKADQLRRNEARKVGKAVRLQKQKLDRIKYEGDIKKEIIRLKSALKMLNRNIGDKHEVNSIMYLIIFINLNCYRQKLERNQRQRRRKKGGGEKKK